MQKGDFLLKLQVIFTQNLALSLCTLVIVIITFFKYLLFYPSYPHIEDKF